MRSVKQSQLPNYRVDKATMLLTYWAFALYRGNKFVEPETGYCASRPVGPSAGKAYKPFCFKLKTNAKSTRAKASGSEPMGGAASAETMQRRSERIDALFAEKFTPRQRMIVFALFVPRSLLNDDASKQLKSDRDIANYFDINPKRASEIKQKAVKLVVLEFLTPAEDPSKEVRRKGAQYARCALSTRTRS